MWWDTKDGVGKGRCLVVDMGFVETDGPENSPHFDRFLYLR